MTRNLNTVKTGDTVTWIIGAVSMTVRVAKATKTQITLTDGTRFSTRTGQQVGYANNPHAPRIAA